MTNRSEWGTVVGRRAVITALGDLPLMEGLKVGTGIGLAGADTGSFAFVWLPSG